MKIVVIMLVLMSSLAFSCPIYANDSDDSESGGGNQALTGALLGGLLGGGLGTAIGSVSGNAGKGALIGAGIGAVGGALVGSTQSSARSKYSPNAAQPEPDKVVTEGSDVSSDAKVKKRIVKQYDAQGNLISEQQGNQ